MSWFKHTIYIRISFTIIDELHWHRLQTTHRPQRRQRCSITPKNRWQRYSSHNKVGFQSRFQTAGTLIFKPPEQSSLQVSGTIHQIKNKKDSTKIMISMIESNATTIDRSNKISTMLDSKKESNDSRTSGRKKMRRWVDNSRKDYIIRK